MKQYYFPQKIFTDSREYHVFLYILTFLGGAVAVIVFNSVLYNGWRQLYFLYPAFILISSYALYHLRAYFSQYKILLSSMVFLQFMLIMIFNVFNHPFQHLYFNQIVQKTPNYINQHYEYEYWGTSYKKALELILKLDNRKQITINVANWPGVLNTQIFDTPTQERLTVNLNKSIGDADYFISNEIEHSRQEKAELIYEHKVQNSSVFTIWKAK